MHILETTIFSDKSVLRIGLGTAGAHVAIELAKCGVGHFVLIDRDRLSVGNVVRHPGGISHVGRYKVHVLRDLIHDKIQMPKCSHKRHSQITTTCQPSAANFCFIVRSLARLPSILRVQKSVRVSGIFER